MSRIHDHDLDDSTSRSHMPKSKPARCSPYKSAAQRKDRLHHSCPGRWDDTRWQRNPDRIGAERGLRVSLHDISLPRFAVLKSRGVRVAEPNARHAHGHDVVEDVDAGMPPTTIRALMRRRLS